MTATAPAAARIEAVEIALRDAGTLAASERITAVTQVPGGWSRHTHIAQATGAGGPTRRFVVRVKPAGGLLDTNLVLEHRVYGVLETQDLPTPVVYAYVAEPDPAFGGPFLVMEHLPGHAPDMYARGDQERLAADWADGRGIAVDMVQALARIHGTPLEQLPADVPALDFAAVVQRWERVYAEKRLVRDPVIEEAFDWVRGRTPPDVWTGLVHGDFRIGNTLVEDGHVRAILDWELVYLGDVRFDLGYLTMPRAAGKHLRARSPLMGTFADQEWFLGRYEELTRRTVDRDVLRTFRMVGIMMLLATQLQAVWMYAHARTTDFRMAWSRFSFAGLRQDMVRLMEW